MKTDVSWIEIWLFFITVTAMVSCNRLSGIEDAIINATKQTKEEPKK